MKKGTKYETKGLVENQFQPGSGQRVLKNLLQIRHKRTMDEKEAREQLRTLNKMASMYDEDHVFVAGIFVTFTGFGCGEFIPGQVSIGRSISVRVVFHLPQPRIFRGS